MIGVGQDSNKSSPHAIIYDYVLNEKSLCYNTLRHYTTRHFDALYKLDPYERWNLLTNTVGQSTVPLNEFPPLLTKEQTVERLSTNGFYNKLNSLIGQALI